MEILLRYAVLWDPLHEIIGYLLSSCKIAWFDQDSRSSDNLYNILIHSNVLETSSSELVWYPSVFPVKFQCHASHSIFIGLNRE